MQFTTQVIAILSALSSTSFAANVYSSFYDNTGAHISSTNFDVGNKGCFTNYPARHVSFSQGSSITGVAEGPYCLTGFKEQGCKGGKTSQEFKDVKVNDDKYLLHEGLKDAYSFHWRLGNC